MIDNENDCQISGSQMLGFLPPGGVLVMSPGQVNKATRGPVVAMPIAELFMQHKRPDWEKPVSKPQARLS